MKYHDEGDMTYFEKFMDKSDIWKYVNKHAFDEHYEIEERSMDTFSMLWFTDKLAIVIGLFGSFLVLQLTMSAI